MTAATRETKAKGGKKAADRTSEDDPGGWWHGWVLNQLFYRFLVKFQLFSTH
jgi:hypothetical protein